MALPSGSVTVEKQHIAIGTACIVLAFFVKFAFTVGQSHGSDKSTYDLQFQQQGLSLARIESSIKSAEDDRKIYQNGITLQLGEFKANLAVLQQRVDDLSLRTSKVR